MAGLQWVVDAYTLALASIMLTAGSTADRIGARKVFTFGLAAFAVGSAACAAAPALGVLVAARAVQGLGASAMLPCSLALLVHQFPDARARARALGVWGAMGSLGVALGPVAGGVLITLAGWRSIFLVNVPICLVTIVLLRRYATESPRNSGRRVDVPGLLLGVTMLAAITAGFITAGEQGWLAPLPGALLVAGLITGWLFVRAERRHPHPLLPLTLFRSRELSGATGVGLLFNLVLYGTLLCLSLYLQQARHESVLATGLLLLPSSVFVGVGSLASGILNAARQSGGALGVAVLGSLLGHAPSLRVPLLVATAGYLVAIALAWITIPGGRERRAA
jgi:DHA2 family methylenomycin A resistance protein-like MFS transporter